MVLRIERETKFYLEDNLEGRRRLASWLTEEDADTKVYIEDGFGSTLAAEWDDTTWKQRSKEKYQKEGEESEEEEDNGETQLLP